MRKGVAAVLFVALALAMARPASAREPGSHKDAFRPMTGWKPVPPKAEKAEPQPNEPRPKKTVSREKPKPAAPVPEPAVRIPAPGEQVTAGTPQDGWTELKGAEAGAPGAPSSFVKVFVRDTAPERKLPQSGKNKPRETD